MLHLILLLFKKSIINYRLLSLALCLLISCKTSNVGSNTEFTNDKYFGERGTYEVYLKVSEQSAFIDVIIRDKYPRLHIGEIIKLDTISGLTWIGQKFILIKEDNYFFVNAVDIKDSILFDSPFKVTLNHDHYAKLETRKNEVFFYKELAIIKKTDPINYQSLNEKIGEHKLFEKIETLELNEFKIEFEKFKNSIR
jgi:hypothetical protein